MHEQKVKYLLSNTCQFSVERRVLDLESEVMRGPGSIPTGGSILSLDYICFHAVKMKMPILAFLCVCEKLYLCSPQPCYIEGFSHDSHF